MTTFAQLAKGGQQGEGVTLEPGDPDASLFVELIRPGGGLCEVINAEAGSEVVPVFFIQELFARVSVTPDEKPYPFPLHALAVTHTGRAQRKTKSMSVTVSEREAASPQVMAIAARWGLEWRLPRPAIRKVLMDLGLVHE